MKTPEQPYLKVLTALRAQVETGEIAPGERYPSISDLVTEHGVAPTTARRALTKLKEAGLAESRHGVGWFATAPPPPAPSIDEQVQQLQERLTHVEQLVEQLSAERDVGP